MNISRRSPRRERERGAFLVEMSLLVELIAIVCIGAVTALGDSVSDTLSSVDLDGDESAAVEAPSPYFMPDSPLAPCVEGQESQLQPVGAYGFVCSGSGGWVVAFAEPTAPQPAADYELIAFGDGSGSTWVHPELAADYDSNPELFASHETFVSLFEPSGGFDSEQV